jgi:pyruvate kinase
MPHSAGPERADLAATLDTLRALDAAIARQAGRTVETWAPWLARAEFAAGAENLAAYLALRAEDRSDLQRRLRRHGLSTLGRSEGRVRASIGALVATLEGRDPDPATDAAFAAAPRMLAEATETLFGPAPQGRRTRILVTLEPAVALDPAAMAELVRRGADAVRINCAHDGPDAWRAMAAAAREAAAAQGRPIRVMMDLGGPKIRTTDLSPKDTVRLDQGDMLVIRRDPRAAHPRGVRASCGCTLPEALAAVAPGAPAMIDDGKFVARVERADAEALWLRIERTKPGGAKLKADKGLNFPGSAVRVAALTARDRADLDVVREIADAVEYSFVQTADDVLALHEAIARRPRAGAPLGVIAKIETTLAFRNLPEIMVAGAGRAPFGVMIARGDLGVEVGFARLSEVQEEILWLCEAAHVPVIWATEVLAALIKTGVPVRGEFTDAAMGARAECVMLNKGAHLAEGVSALDDVLRRAERHLDKKTPQLAALRSWAAG